MAKGFKGKKSRIIANGGKPRKRTWEHKTTAQSLVGGPRDDRTIVLTPPQPVDLVRPKWSKAYPLVCRIFPNFDYEDPTRFEPTRRSDDPNDLSDWVRVVPAARYVGLDQNFTFVLYDPRLEKSGQYSAFDNPFVILQNAFAQALKAGNAYVGTRDVMTGKWTAIDKNGNLKPKTSLYLYQGLVYANGEQVYVDRNEPPKGAGDRSRTQIVQVSGTAGQALQELIAAVREDYTGDTSNQDEYYVAGDLVDLERGKFVVFFNPTSAGHVDQLANLLPEEEYNVFVDALEDEIDKTKKGGGFVGWRTIVADSFTYRRKTFSADLTEYGWEDAAARVQWWDDLLRFPSHDEICLWLASAFRSEPGLLEFGWKDNPEFFTDEVDGILRARSSLLVKSDAEGEDEGDDEPDYGEEETPVGPQGGNGRRFNVPSRFAESAMSKGASRQFDELEEYEVAADDDDSESDDAVDEDDAVAEELEAEIEADLEEPAPAKQKSKSKSKKDVTAAREELLKRLQERRRKAS